MEDLPDEYEVIVVGTGLVESIVAGALSRIGKKVLHIDENHYYGGEWASFNLKGINDWIEKMSSLTVTDEACSSNEILLRDCGTVFTNIKSKTTSNSADNNDCDSNFPIDNEMKRKFNIDLAPKILYSCGPMVKLLISSNSSKYMEFKSVTKMLTLFDGSLIKVPFTRADVFSSKKMTVIEKRLLMKLLTVCAESESSQSIFNEFKGKPFTSFLKHHKLSPLTEAYVRCMLNILDKEDITTEEGIAAVRKFLDSIGHYGPSPFLWPLYGSGELPQAFCRVCAVFGGTYYLSCPLKALVLDDRGKVCGVNTGSKVLHAEKVVLSSSYLSHKLNTKIPGISRGILITNRPLLKNSKEITIGTISSPIYPHSIILYELGYYALSTPEGFYVVHLITRQTDTASADLLPTVEQLFSHCGSENSNQGGPNSGDEGEHLEKAFECDSQAVTPGTLPETSADDDHDDDPIENVKPNVIWSLYFNVQDQLDADLTQHGVTDLYVCPGAGMTIDMADHVQKAREIFLSMYPGEEFLPRMPNPEDIVFDDPVAEPNVIGLVESTTDVHAVERQE